MAALVVQSADADRSEAVRVELRTILLDGAVNLMGTPVVGGVFGPAGMAAAPSTTLDMLEAVALALVRLQANGPTLFPARLPACSKGALPSAASNTGALIWVTDEVDGSVPAFSDGTNWRRVTDRAIVS